MSWHYLRGLEAESWEGTSLDGAPDALLKLMPTPEKCSLPGSGTDACQGSLFGTTCEHSKDIHGADTLTSSAEDSLAKTSAQPERAQESPENEAVCGSTWRESSVKYDLNSHGWKTHRCLWEEDLPWSSVTLPKWGMMRDGVLWERDTPSFLPEIRFCSTGETAFGSLRVPTPTVHGNTNRKGASKNSGDGLSTFVNRVPTPTARDWKDTPGMAKTAKNPNGSIRHRNDQLARVVYAQDHNADGGTLNPTWVEWLMGWPLLWTSTEPMPQATWRVWESAFRSERTDCAASETDKSPQV